MKHSLILLFLITFTISMYGQFQVCNSNTDKVLHDVFFLNENEGIAVGEAGTIIRSQDGGINWYSVLQIDTVQFKKVKFWDDLNGIASGSSIYITMDGGNEWNVLDIQNDFFTDIEIMSDSEAIVAGWPIQIYKLSDFGQSFEQVNADSTGIFFGHLSFINESIGYGHFQDGALARLYKTQNGGINWNEIESTSTPQEDFTLIEDLKFLTEDVGFRGGWYNSNLVKTNDGGLNWNQADLENAQITFWSSIYDFHIENDQPNAFYACGWYGDIFKSIDGGVNWVQLESHLPTSTSLRGIYFLDDDTGWVVGDSGTILKTTNGGGLTSTHDLIHKNVSFSPNPASEIITISGIDINEIERILIYNINGQIIGDLNPVKSIDVSKFISGVYIFELQTLNKRIRERIVIN